jgi:UDP-N-acetylmuramoylalanine--D-glutamate ligase
MTLDNLQNKKIALLGLGVENYALLKFLLAKKVKAHFIICDQRSPKLLGDKFKELNRFDNVVWQLGKEFNKKLSRYDVLFRSPGWPLHCSGITEAKKYNKKIIITSPMKLFFDISPTKNIIGVTGTKGKGTTSSLICDILKIAKKRVWLGGNIGVAPFAFISKVKLKDWVVLELSSFQLEDMNKSPRIAVMTNFTLEHQSPADPNNPNFHYTLADYFKAKLNVWLWQTRSDYLVVNDKLQDRILNLDFLPRSEAGVILKQINNKKIYFQKSELPSNLVGEHNKENIAAAEAVAKIIGIKKELVAKAVKNFKGLEHRIELVRELKGVKYYDDSFATTPESAVIALKSFPQPIVLLAGGADKGADFKIFATTIKKRVKFICLLKGKATPRLKREIIKAGFIKKQIKEFTNIKQAVKVASKQARFGDIVLLSTACASFGMFKSYKQRGDLFKEAVKQLK